MSTTQCIEALRELRLSLERHQTRIDYFVGDLTLWGCILGVWESGSAAIYLVRETDFGSASLPCARLAFECAQDALLLATAPDYNEAGSRARVFERLELADLQDAVRSAFGESDQDSGQYCYNQVAALIEADAAKWSTMQPGRGDLLLDALSHFKPRFMKARQGSRHPGHWSELTRRRIASEIGKRLEEPDLASRMIAIYSALSRYSHPRLNLETWTKAESKCDSVRYERSGQALRMATDVVEFSAKLAMRAFLIKQPAT